MNETKYALIETMLSQLDKLIRSSNRRNLTDKKNLKYNLYFPRDSHNFKIFISLCNCLFVSIKNIYSPTNVVSYLSDYNYTKIKKAIYFYTKL